jgi:gas vesicle protein
MSTQGRQVAKVAGLVAGGAVIGAGLALLFAPQPGAETRRQLSHYAKRAQSQAARLGQSVKAGVGQTMEYGRAIMTKKETEPKAA